MGDVDPWEEIGMICKAVDRAEAMDPRKAGNCRRGFGRKPICPICDCEVEFESDWEWVERPYSGRWLKRHDYYHAECVKRYGA